MTDTEKANCLRFLMDISLDDFEGRDEFALLSLSGEEQTYLQRYRRDLEMDFDCDVFTTAAILELAKFGHEAEQNLIEIFQSNRDRFRMNTEHDDHIPSENIDEDPNLIDERGNLEDVDEKETADSSYQHNSMILEILSGIGSKKTIDFAVQFLSDEQDSLFVYHKELPRIFETIDREYAVKKIFNAITEGNKNNEPRDFRLIITLTDLIGAGEALQRINKLIVENKKSNPQAVENLKSARVYLVPEKNKKIFAELESFYREFNIKEHDLNKEMTPKEIPLLKQLIPPGSKVLESGCGTGRLLLALKGAGYDISGYDLLPENVDEVIKVDPEADVSVDNWYQTKYPDENFDAVYSFGRNILHEYSLPGQVQLFREAARVLKKGGKFIFDVPNREKGIYAENIRAYKEAMNREGIRNIREGTVYDSPNGEHFSTRYCFSHKDIENLAQLTGFRIAEVRRSPLPTGKGDENLYYVLEKI